MPITRLSSPAPKVPGDPKKPLVLCVDDDGAVLASLRRLFRGEPYDVITTASAAQALACLRRHPVSVIISDERMPGTSGSELLAEVRERWPWIGRIILTSFPGHEVMIRGLQAGVDFLLYKPWDEESLKRTIERLIQEVERTRSLLDAGSAKGADRAAEGEEASSTQPLRERHVVVAVDDDPQVLLALRRALRREPYQVLTTNLPEEAIRWIESLDVSAVLSDERMPEISGTELLERVSERSPETARLMLTGYGRETAQQTGLRPFVECLIAKPWDDLMLRTTLREFLFQREAQDPCSHDSIQRKGSP